MPITVTARAGDPAETAADTRVVPLFEGEALAEASSRRWWSSARPSPALGKVAVAHEAAPGAASAG